MHRQTTRTAAKDPKRIVVWTHCEKCGDTWVTKAVLRRGKCPICRGKPKSQKAIL